MEINVKGNSKEVAEFIQQCKLKSDTLIVQNDKEIIQNKGKETDSPRERQSQIRQNAVMEIVKILYNNGFTISEANEVLCAARIHLDRQKIKDCV